MPYVIAPVALTHNGIGLERFWTMQQFRLTDRVALFVNLWNGNLVAQYDEFAIPSRGLPLSLNHAFNSRTNVSSTLGYNWTHSLAWRVVSNVANGVSLYDGDGTQLVFSNPSGGVYSSPPGNYDKLATPSRLHTKTRASTSLHAIPAAPGISPRFKTALATQSH